MTSTLTCSHFVMILVFLIGCAAATIGAFFFSSARDSLGSGHIIAAIANVVEQQQLGTNCVTVVNLAPGINATVIEAWTCNKSFYTPQKLIPLCHKWQQLLDFSVTSWDSSHEEPECAGYWSAYQYLIAGKALLFSGAAIAASISVSVCVLVPCLALIKHLRAGSRVADINGMP